MLTPCGLGGVWLWGSRMPTRDAMVGTAGLGPGTTSLSQHFVLAEGGKAGKQWDTVRGMLQRPLWDPCWKCQATKQALSPSPPSPVFSLMGFPLSRGNEGEIWHLAPSLGS